MFQHLLGVKVCDEKGNIISLMIVSKMAKTSGQHLQYLDGFPPQNEKGLGALGQEASELVDKNVLNLIGLLYPDADSDAVDAGFYQDALVFVAGYRQRIEKHFWGALGLDFRNVVTLRRLRSEIGEGEGRCQRCPNALEIWAEGLRLLASQ